MMWPSTDMRNLKKSINADEDLKEDGSNRTLIDDDDNDELQIAKGALNE